MTAPCSEISSSMNGTRVLTPSGNFNGNCVVPGPNPVDQHSITPCETFFPGSEGNLITTPSGHIKFHCNASSFG